MQHMNYESVCGGHITVLLTQSIAVLCDGASGGRVVKCWQEGVESFSQNVLCQQFRIFFISLEDSAQHNRVISDTPGYFKVLTLIACSKQYKCEGSYRIRKDSHCEGCDKCFSALSDTVEVNGRRFSGVFSEKPWDALCTSSSPLHVWKKYIFIILWRQE